MLFNFLSVFIFINYVTCHGTLHPKIRPSFNFCLKKDDTIAVRLNDSSDCKKLIIDVHKYNNNLVINFKNSKGICSFLCIDKCGNVYHDSVLYTEDCVLTTAAFENVDTLSVYRGNYSDFFAAQDYYVIPLSMKSGNSIERFYNYLALTFNEISKTKKCNLILTPLKSTKMCTTSYLKRYENMDYIDRKNYQDYSFWNKLLIVLGVKSYVIPKNDTILSYKEYN
ncbi:FGF-1 [Choristoneura occidentalis granulovirus]|uniref:FGF-1 n=1 Tax=Choristoneura occidentalis granulovirus TaxID=364745 RepID=Q1A4N9_9BBAC|nr:FGF-1 [Choristoneura fumiferana granulovirus]ABC61191.1 FGF-1 [Choristoneura fumiferana granulovirus]